MKRILLLPLAVCVLVHFVAGASELAQATMYGLSIRVFQAQNGAGDLVKLNSSGGTPDGDFELQPLQLPDVELSLPGVNSYGTGMWIYDSYFKYWSSGTIYLNPPDFTDTNNNKFPDFFEVSLGVKGGTANGSYTYYDPQLFDNYSGNISVIWNRPAGSKNGTCVMTFSDPYWGTFYGTFEILEYKGTLAYTPGAASVTGSLNLAQTGSNNTYQGSLIFVKSDTNRFNSLILQAGTLTNISSQASYFTNHYFFRDAGWPTNYAGYVQFDNDGDQNSPFPWAVWVLSINDTNDANHNGIPDFSDDPGAPPAPRPPLLSLLPTATNLLLTIHGDTGHTHTIQQSASLASGSWQLLSAFVLTNDPTVVPIATSGSAGFWKVQAQ